MSVAICVPPLFFAEALRAALDRAQSAEGSVEASLRRRAFVKAQFPASYIVIVIVIREERPSPGRETFSVLKHG